MTVLVDVAVLVAPALAIRSGWRLVASAFVLRLLGLLAGSGLGRHLARAARRALQFAWLGVVDSTVGALARGAIAALVCSALASLVLAFAPPSWGAPVGRSVALGALSPAVSAIGGRVLAAAVRHGNSGSPCSTPTAG